MVESRDWPEIAARGRTIRDALSKDGEQNPTVGWMAFRVAELMLAAETETSPPRRDKLKKECSDLILELWRLQRGSAQDNPIHEINQALRHIADMRPPPWRRYHPVAPGGKKADTIASERLSVDKLVPKLMSLADEEQELIYSLVAAGLPVNVPVAANSAEELYGGQVDRGRYDHLQAARKSVHDSPLAMESPAILDAETKEIRCAKFVEGLHRILGEKLRIARMCST